jgi:Ni/Fe-hydrogenase subunit HybB-like protein
MKRWERAVPVYGLPVLTRGFWVLAALVVFGGVLTLIREYIGLGATSGMTDPFAWGIWKTFNVMTLTGLGSGGFAVGICAFVFNNQKLHKVMRVALLTSGLAYWTGLIMLGVDVGRPWNFYWVMMPWNWNTGSPLLEVAVCISLYASVPLLLENVPPLLEYVIYEHPQYKPLALKIESLLKKVFPFVIALAYILPMMHQSSLGALMLLGGDRVHALWQSPFLPLLYVWAAGYLGFACTMLAILLAKLAWKRFIDWDVAEEMNKITMWLIFAWTGFRFVDILFRGKLLTAFAFDRYAFFFWLETALVLGGALMLKSERRRNLGYLFNAYLAIAVGGMVYRMSPTTLAFQPRAGAFYFPNVWEFMVAVGYIALAVLVYLVAVKKLAILPGSNEDWKKMAEYEAIVKPEVKLTGYEVVEH